ncbi:MAG: lysophospholipid acyltransferase family protein [Spongiibacteraceae bacterium]|nr:lysophospholipid acyltransferase family protein [Spongiibacteraceae bacterium]
MKSFLLIALIRGLALLPLALLHRLARPLGAVMWHLARELRAQSLANLAACLPELTASERKQLARSSFRHFVATALETGANWCWPVPKLLGCIDAVHGQDLLEAALAEQRGVIVLVPHQGNWELTGFYFNAHHPTAVLFRHFKEAGIANFITRARERTGGVLAADDIAGVRKLLKMLRSGGIVGILPDQVPDASGGDMAPFFGRPALTMSLVRGLARRSAAPVLCAWTERSTPGRFTLHIIAASDGIADDDTTRALTALNHSVERVVRACPAQYRWEYKRFKLPRALREARTAEQQQNAQASNPQPEQRP